jgi:hypothetical protein
MQKKAQKKAYCITLVFKNNITREVYVRANSRKTAEARALKRNSTAVRVGHPENH